MTFQANNLEGARSPYLRQHAGNPVWWQEWAQEVLDYARLRKKPLLVSVGYSTCHWCHVMASESFSDQAIADYLNEHFVAIKVDREERPDIDHYLMSFLVALKGGGGWPLNAFLTADGKPFFAMTYAAPEPRFNIPGFGDVLRRIIEFHDQNHDSIEPFELNAEHSGTLDLTAKAIASLISPDGDSEAPPMAMIGEDDDGEIRTSLEELEASFDTIYGGFGDSQKFPPHSVLLYLEHALAADFENPSREIVGGTLDAMMTRGLHDHLQGGFFRYAVDRDWTIPHFEKMLYDQAMLLWNYSLAVRLFADDPVRHAGYRETAQGIVHSLEQTFRVGRGYASAHDADTDHTEGATYLWQKAEIEQALGEEEIDAFSRVFTYSDEGNMEGRNHLLRSLPPGYEADSSAKHGPDRAVLRRATQRLLEIRRLRTQPQRDDKILLDWNALTGCALLMAHRYAAIPRTLERAIDLAGYLVETLTGPETVYHLILDGKIQEQEFLTDTAALLLFLDMLAEESEELETQYAGVRSMLLRRLASFSRDGYWYESNAEDFQPVPADPFDQPVPSGISLADYAVVHAQMRTHGEYGRRDLQQPQARAFANLTALASRGYTYVVESPEEVSWSEMPVNAVRVRGEARTSCYRGVCYLGPPPKKNRGRAS